MILRKEELALLRKGRRSFTLRLDPGWEPGRVVRLRSSGHEEGFQVTITKVVPDGQGFKVLFTPGDSRPERRFLSVGWPDYTSDMNRAMPGENPPMPEEPEEKKARGEWLQFALGAGARANPRRGTAPRTTVRWRPYCKRCGVELKRPTRSDPTAPPAPLPTYCSDKCVLLARYEGRRVA